MKYAFFAIVFANIVFVLWEFHHGAFEPVPAVEEAGTGGEKQILLVSEVEARGGKAPLLASVIPPPVQYPLSSAEQIDVIAPMLLQQRPMAQSGIPQPGHGAQVAAGTMLRTEVKEVHNLESTMLADNAGAEVQKPASEEPEPEAGKENVAEVTPAEPELPLHSACYRFGPLPDDAPLQTLLHSYRPLLTGLRLAKREQRKNNSYWVYYPAAATPEETQAQLENLKTAYGAGDALILRNGDLKGAISLGVYSNEQRARTAQQQFAQQGLQVQIKPRYPLESYYVVQASWSNEQGTAAMALRQTLRQRYPALKQGVAACSP